MTVAPAKERCPQCANEDLVAKKFTVGERGVTVHDFFCPQCGTLETIRADEPGWEAKLARWQTPTVSGGKPLDKRPVRGVQRYTELAPGHRQCYECGGDGACTMCDGSGRIDGNLDTYCHGTGRCIVCRGAGQIPADSAQPR